MVPQQLVGPNSPGTNRAPPQHRKQCDPGAPHCPEFSRDDPGVGPTCAGTGIPRLSRGRPAIPAGIGICCDTGEHERQPKLTSTLRIGSPPPLAYRRPVPTDADQVFQINHHLLHELKWMVHAADLFEHARRGDPVVEYLDSAAVHARNVFDFAYHESRSQFTLAALGGARQLSAGWWDWANNRVTHMRQREQSRVPYPNGISPTDPRRAMLMAGDAIAALEAGRRQYGPVW